MGTRLSGSRLQAVSTGEAGTPVTVGQGQCDQCATDCEEHGHPLLSSVMFILPLETRGKSANFKCQMGQQALGSSLAC